MLTEEQRSFFYEVFGFEYRDHPEIDVEEIRYLSLEEVAQIEQEYQAWLAGTAEGSPKRTPF